MHENARLTPKGREVLVQRQEAGQRVSEVAQALGISETRSTSIRVAPSPAKDVQCCSQNCCSHRCLMFLTDSLTPSPEQIALDDFMVISGEIHHE